MHGQKKWLLALSIATISLTTPFANAEWRPLDQCVTLVHRFFGITPDSHSPVYINPSALKSLGELYPLVDFTKHDPVDFITERYSNFFTPGGKNRFEIRELVYASSHSIVLRAIDLNTKQDVAIKILRDGMPSQIIDHAIHKTLPSLISVSEYSYNRRYPGEPGFIVSEWLNRPNYYQELINLKESKNAEQGKDQIKSYLKKMYTLVKDITQLNKEGWLLTDPKPLNFGFDATGKLKIFDLDSLSYFVEGKGIDLDVQTPRTSVAWASPEVNLFFRSHDPSPHVDYSWVPKGTIVDSVDDSKKHIATLINSKSDAFSVGKIIEKTINKLIEKNKSPLVQKKLEHIRKTIVAPLLIENPNKRENLEQALEPLAEAIKEF